MLGKLLDGRYQVLQVLRAGGFGETYIAEDTRRPGNPRCVVKHLKPLSSDPNYLQTARRLFRSEAETLEKLGNHDQIPRLLAYNEAEFYLVQEFIAGHPLSAELHPGQPWSESQTIQLLQDVLGILTFVHGYGVIHRDIKPDNLIRRASDGKLVLIDFGAVKQVHTQLPLDGNPMGGTVAVGTPGYVPREQVMGRPRPSSDIYALGIIGIQAVTGLFPNQLQEDPVTREFLWQHHAQVSAGLAYFLSQMVRSDDRNRYQSPTEALTVLQQLTSPYPPTQVPNSPPLPIASTQPLPVAPVGQNVPPVATTTSSYKFPLLIGGIAVAVSVGVAIAYINSVSAPPSISARNPDSTPSVTSSPDNNSNADSTPQTIPSLDTGSNSDPTPSVTSSPQNTPPATSSNEFDAVEFPLASCGDALPTNSASPTPFYPVFIEYSESNLQAVKSNFCADAYKANRKDTGQEAIQVASFTARDRAASFSDFLKRKIGSGDIGQPTVYSATNSTETPSSDNCSTVVSDPDSPLNVREQPDDSLENVVSTLEDGTPITVVNEQNGWLQISSPVQGWVAKNRTKTVCQ